MTYSVVKLIFELDFLNGVEMRSWDCRGEITYHRKIEKAKCVPPIERARGFCVAAQISKSAKSAVRTEY